MWKYGWIHWRHNQFRTTGRNVSLKWLQRLQRLQSMSKRSVVGGNENRTKNSRKKSSETTLLPNWIRWMKPVWFCSFTFWLILNVRISVLHYCTEHFSSLKIMNKIFSTWRTIANEYKLHAFDAEINLLSMGLIKFHESDLEF